VTQRSNIRGGIGETSDVSLCDFVPTSNGSKKTLLDGIL
jgi:hypothetical protein